MPQCFLWSVCLSELHVVEFAFKKVGFYNRYIMDVTFLKTFNSYLILTA